MRKFIKNYGPFDDNSSSKNRFKINQPLTEENEEAVENISYAGLNSDTLFRKISPLDLLRLNLYLPDQPAELIPAIHPLSEITDKNIESIDYKASDEENYSLDFARIHSTLFGTNPNFSDGPDFSH